MKSRKLSLIVNSLVFLALVVTSLASPANAQPTLTFTVTANTDVVDATPGDGVCETETGNGMCTLRAAIMEANAHVGADTIILPAAEYNLTLPGADEDLGASGDLDITDSLTITGAGYGDTIIDANAVDDRVLTVFLTNDPVTISGVKIQSGNSLTSNGGGIMNYSDLILEDVYFWLNQARSYGGGIWNQNSLTMSGVSFIMNSAARLGGGVYSIGSILSEDDYFGVNNSEEGGGLYATSSSNVHLVSADFNSNHAATDGGNIYTAGELTIEDSVVVLGEAGNAGGGIFIVDNATTTLTDVILHDNHAGTGGGIWLGMDATLTGSDLIMRANSADAAGGAIHNKNGDLQIYRSFLSENSAESGGAISTEIGNTTLSESTIISNTATTYGGGIQNNGYMTLSGVALNLNRAQNGGGVFNTVDLKVENSTISKNRSIEDGGGIYEKGFNTSIYNSTITGNLAGATLAQSSGVGGGIYVSDATLFFRNTILSDNHHRHLLNLIDDDCHGILTSGDYNLIGTLNSCALWGTTEHDLIGEDPLLGDLADNGGPTQTHALLENSPAIDGGNPEGCLGIEDALLTSDQRGVKRPLDGDKDGTARCDIGAYELSSYTYVYLPYAVK